MTDDGRSPPSALRGRLADIYVPALVSGDVEALSRRLGNRATIDDPLYGRASSLASVAPLLARVAAYFAEAGAVYGHVCSTTGVDRDAAEGRLSMTVDGQACETPIAVVAERRRLREIELRVYYLPRGPSTSLRPRAPLTSHGPEVALAPLVHAIFGGVKTGALERALAGFEEASQVVDPSGRRHAKSDGAMGAFLSNLGEIDAIVGGGADDGRTSCIEATLARPGHEPCPTLFSFERGESGLVRELRVYWE
jgi:hypothetical protein